MQKADNLPLVGLSHDGATMQFVEFIRGKRGYPDKGRRMSDETKLKSYVAYHRKCRRRENGSWINGAYVENEIICAVAHQNNLIINVAQACQQELQVITPDGSFIRYDDDRAERSPFFLWCTGGHYQAILKPQDVEVLSSALSAPGFTVGNVLKSDDVRMSE